MSRAAIGSAHKLWLSTSNLPPHFGLLRWIRWESTGNVLAAEAFDDDPCSAVDATLKEISLNNHSASLGDSCTRQKQEIHRLQRIRNVGIFAHVDAGKTTVTERMLALAGVVHRAGSVDDGNTVTDYLPAERERGITISSAAISFPWAWHNRKSFDGGDDYVTVSLIDTPGHVDFSVEVNRSVAVLDGAVLVVDAVAGVQAQTETVWRAMTRPSLNNHEVGACIHDHAHEPLPCLALVNKMDKEGSHFGNAIQSLKRKLPGANPIPIQLPLFRSTKHMEQDTYFAQRRIEAIPVDDKISAMGDFVGVVDLVHMRAIVYPDKSQNVANVENCVPDVISLLRPSSFLPIDENCRVTQEAIAARVELLEAVAECDEDMEEIYLAGQEPTSLELLEALRRVTLSKRGVPVMAAAALRGKGVEPVLDAISDLLPSPLDRIPPTLSYSKSNTPSHGRATELTLETSTQEGLPFGLGHALNENLLALAFKVVHMKGRGGSGDGRVVFARVYSGEMNERDSIQVASPPPPGESSALPRKERIGSMLELSGGRFSNLENGVCRSGDVCALVGLKSVVTGDTITAWPERRVTTMKGRGEVVPCLMGVSSPRPVLQVRLEAESTTEQKRLVDALTLLAIEDPSLLVEDSDSGTLLSALGELHVEIILDRIRREFGLDVGVGAPSVAYRETITAPVQTNGLLNYDRLIGGTRLQASVNLYLEPTWKDCTVSGNSECILLSEPVVTVSEAVKTFLNLNTSHSDEELLLKSDVFKALVRGCEGAMKRGSLKHYPLANVHCHVVEIDSTGGLLGLQQLPGALQAAAANAVSSTLQLVENSEFCSMLEPMMSLEITLPNEMVGVVLSDLTGHRRGGVGDVLVGGEHSGTQTKALVRGEVPLAEILGYANALRSLTGGEAVFSAEYKGHAIVSYSRYTMLPMAWRHCSY